MNRLPKPRAVIFDWDDTVIDSWHVALQAFNTAMQAMGHKPWTDEEARKGTGTSARDMFMSLFGSDRKSTRLNVRARYVYEFIWFTMGRS